MWSSQESPSKSLTMESGEERKAQLKGKAVASSSSVTTRTTASSGTTSTPPPPSTTPLEYSSSPIGATRVVGGDTASNFQNQEKEEEEDYFANGDSGDAYFDSFLPGYRFCPHDYELFVDYLEKKVNNQLLPRNKIRDVNLYQHTPDFLAERYQHFGEKQWYFFTPRDRKYKQGTRPNRAAGNGYWKATGADKPVSLKNAVVGHKMTLVYYYGKPPNGTKSNWIMHEFVLEAPPREKEKADDMRLDDWVLCKIYEKKPNGKKRRPQKDQPEPNENCAALLTGNPPPLPPPPPPPTRDSQNNVSEMKFNYHGMNSFTNYLPEVRQYYTDVVPMAAYCGDLGFPHYGNHQVQPTGSRLQPPLVQSTNGSFRPGYADQASDLNFLSFQQDHHFGNIDHFDTFDESQDPSLSPPNN